MDRQQVVELLEAVRRGTCPVDEALGRLRSMPFEDLGFARVDHHRGLRTGVPEVVFGEGKTPEQVIAIAERLATTEANVLVTRLAPEAGAQLVAAVPGFDYEPLARLGVRRARPVVANATGTVLVVAAGTADLPVAEEAAICAEVMGVTVERLWDVGVSGLHRLLAERERLWAASVLIVVAGMEGALPSVVGGLVQRPVIAVPTSIGYGASFAGVAALLGMLSSCAAGLTVVNIDNGFGAAAAAARIVLPSS